MSRYPEYDRAQDQPQPVELQWLESGIHILAKETWAAVCTLARYAVSLLDRL